MKISKILFSHKNKIKIEGRVKSIRKMGRIVFITILDNTGIIQVILKNKLIKIKIGYLLSIEGHKCYNKKKEILLECDKIIILSKNYLLVPDKYHFIKNKKFLLKNKYFDSLDKNKLYKIYLNKINFIKYLRIFFYKKKFKELETPILDFEENTAEANNFNTFYKSIKKKIYLRISPEISLKKAIVLGFKRIFEIGKNFRNESISKNHYPEFTSLEFYVVKKNYIWSMLFLEKMLKKIIYKTIKKKYVIYKNKKIYYKVFNILSINKCIIKYSGLKLFRNIKKMKRKIIKFCNEEEKEILKKNNKEFIRYFYFDKIISKKIIKPTFIVGFPIFCSILAKNKNNNIAERYELYFLKKEIANGYTELNNYKEQLDRFKKQSLTNKKKINFQYIDYLKFGLQNCTGCGLGIDRIIMIISNCKNIKETLLFSNF
ncbi:amino acid--tRNA ligase-related protein [Candidatus Vidania fulgoroideorum]